MEQLKYFVFNKKRDYESGYRQEIRITERGLALEEDVSERGVLNGIFISRLLDSGVEGNQWHRAVIQSRAYGDDSVRFYFYCSDEDHVMTDGQHCPWEELIRSQEISLEKKHQIMEQCLVHIVQNPQDIMLYHARGRYLWLEIQLFCQTGYFP